MPESTQVDPAFKTRVVEVLLQVEWLYNGGTKECPRCLERYKYGHRLDCSLALLLRESGWEEVRFQKE